MRGRGHPGAGALVLLLVGACTAPASPGPIPLGVAPALGPSSAATPVEISGVGFDAEVKTDYGDGSGSTLRSTFAVRLLPWGAGAPVEAGSVALTQRRTLAAVVPAGLAPGRYDVAVTDPAGRTGVLPDGFEVASDAASAVAFRIDPIATQRAGVPFAVSVAAVDAAGRVVSGFAGSLSVSDDSGTAAPTTAGPLVLGRAVAQIGVAVPRAADRLTVSDGAGRTGVSNAFDVGPGVAARIAFVAPPAASASSCSGAFELELRDASGAPAPAPATVTVALQSGPPGALLVFSDPACATPIASLAIPPGAARGAFHLRGAAAGTASLRALPDLLPSAETAVAIAP
ncbi:MAG TPA: hypothetical protein VFL83_15185 [Anaeromyxobacter sp.]|nr:hypothetical protein [Anaeromyxobacter sp.]